MCNCGGIDGSKLCMFGRSITSLYFEIYFPIKTKLQEKKEIILKKQALTRFRELYHTSESFDMFDVIV